MDYMQSVPIGLICFAIVFIVLGLIYILLRLSAIAIRLIETRTKKQKEAE